MASAGTCPCPLVASSQHPQTRQPLLTPQPLLTFPVCQQTRLSPSSTTTTTGGCRPPRPQATSQAAGWCAVDALVLTVTVHPVHPSACCTTCCLVNLAARVHTTSTQFQQLPHGLPLASEHDVLLLQQSTPPIIVPLLCLSAAARHARRSNHTGPSLHAALASQVRGLAMGVS